jgi:hypothetical protein
MELLTDETFVTLDFAPPSCQIRLEAACEASEAYDCFVVEICGSIPGCTTPESAYVEIRIEDVTEGVGQIKPVLTKGQDSTTSHLSSFSCQTGLGTLPPQGMHLEEWTALMRIRADWLVLARSGRRSLLFHVHILTGPTKQKLISTKSITDYQNPGSGYIELREHQRTLRLGATALAFAAADVDRKHTKAQFDMIRQWAAHGLNLELVSLGARCRFWLALKSMAHTVGANCSGLQALCQHIVRTTPSAQRYDIMNLCLQVMSVRNSISKKEMAFIGLLTAWLQLDSEHIRVMIEKTLPIGLFEELDSSSLLGITSDMSQEQIRKHLNREYAKWNARVTHSDPGVQTQAEQMLDLIARTRSQCFAEITGESESPNTEGTPRLISSSWGKTPI